MCIKPRQVFQVSQNVTVETVDTAKLLRDPLQSLMEFSPIMIILIADGHLRCVLINHSCKKNCVYVVSYKSKHTCLSLHLGRKGPFNKIWF